MKKVILCIMDGIGLSDNTRKNALVNANTPTLDNLFINYPNTKLDASGPEVGLPLGQMGNSEVGHSNIGAGRVVYQSLEYINRKVESKEFYKNEEMLATINHVKKNNSNLHIMGLLSDGGIHSHINHLFSIIDMCHDNELTNVYLHIFTDGRDTKTDSAMQFIKMLEEKLAKVNVGRIATISGRFYAMDRDNRIKRIKLFYETVVNGDGPNYLQVEDAILDNYNKGITDEFIVPATIKGGKRIDDNDGIIVFNFRPDRLRELLTVIKDDSFEGFATRKIANLKITTMMSVCNDKYAKSAFTLPKIENSLGIYLASLGLKQLRIAETEKYAHVTYFFDGGQELDLKGEKKLLIPSCHVKTYDLKPEMSAYEITDTLINELKENDYDLVVLNFANGDMVGHTGNYDATVKAVSTVDKCLGKILSSVDTNKYTIIVTADHGNCEVMENTDGSINTNHTTNKVPFIVVDKNVKLDNQGGKLANIAPTILDIMQIDKPTMMIENSLILQ